MSESGQKMRHTMVQKYISMGLSPQQAEEAYRTEMRRRGSSGGKKGGKKGFASASHDPRKAGRAGLRSRYGKGNSGR